jgi:hypothetical protein
MTTAHASLVVVLRLSVEARALSHHFLAKKKTTRHMLPFCPFSIYFYCTSAYSEKLSTKSKIRGSHCTRLSWGLINYIYEI